RRAGIEAALRENPDMGDETIAVVFFLDVGLKRCQQMFADLNRYAVRPTTSLSILYDHADEDAQIVKTVLTRVPIFTDLTGPEPASSCCTSTRATGSRSWPGSIRSTGRGATPGCGKGGP